MLRTDSTNYKFHYPYVFLYEVPFLEDFKKRISNIVSGEVDLGVIPRDHWFQPDWIDEEKATVGREKMVKDNIIYGGSVSYRNMCRFNSGFFFKHPLLQKNRWYWRIEIYYHHVRNRSYHSYALGTRQRLHQLEYLSKDNAMDYMSDNGEQTCNLCHFWSNFEIADMDFWRGNAYQACFEYLDKKGWFYYELWGDAPVHSIGAALFASKDQITSSMI